MATNQQAIANKANAAKGIALVFYYYKSKRKPSDETLRYAIYALKIKDAVKEDED